MEVELTTGNHGTGRITGMYWCSSCREFDWRLAGSQCEICQRAPAKCLGFASDSLRVLNGDASQIALAASIRDFWEDCETAWLRLRRLAKAEARTSPLDVKAHSCGRWSVADRPLILRRSWRGVCYYSGDPGCDGETSPRVDQFDRHRLCDPCMARARNGPKGTRLIARDESDYEGEGHLTTRFICHGCQQEPVTRKGNLCAACLNHRRTSKAVTSGNGEHLDRKRNCATTFRSGDEVNHDDHIPRRDRGRWRPLGRPGFKPSDLDQLPDLCRRFANDGGADDDRTPVTHLLLNTIRKHKRLPLICATISNDRPVIQETLDVSSAK
jgi:hypothetical protein